ncbi:MAG: ABC transporter permease [Firmicutes bacterium]|nr:ABC transporter permease [Bacillota bacterium]
MSRYILKRILICIPTLVAITFIIFTIMSYTPGDVTRMILGQEATPEAMKELAHQMGLDKPFFVRYANYMVHLLQGDMGVSYRSGQSVFLEIIHRFPITLKLAFGSMCIAIAVGLLLGILAAVKQYSILDFFGTALAMLLASVPYFWLGLMMILLFSLKLGLLPSMGSNTWVHFILPSITVCVGSTAAILRLTRTTMLETIRQDYIRTARAKGQTEGKIIFKHALKNALLPVITVIGIEFGSLLGGAVVVESVFSLNGVGSLLLQAIRLKDTPQVTGCAVFLAFFFMMIMLAVDILYAYIDPRIKARYQNS